MLDYRIVIKVVLHIFFLVKCMAKEKPFLAVLLTVVFLALGVMGLLSVMLYIGVELTEEMQLMLLLTAVLGVGYIVAGYGLYQRATWGWVLAAAFTVLNLIGNILYESYLAITVDAIIMVLLLLTAKHYGITFLAKPAKTVKPSTIVPPPSAPVAAFVEPKKEKRFVRRKHRY